MEFAVVKFVKTNSVDIVPCGWLYEDKTYWPPKNLQSGVLPHRDKKISPAEYWDLYDIYIIGIFATYADAQRKLRIAQQRSDLDSTDPEDLGRGKRKKFKSSKIDFLSSEESDEDYIIPNTPPLSMNKKSNKENRRPVIEKIFADNDKGDKRNFEDSFTLSTCTSGYRTNVDSSTLSTSSASQSGGPKNVDDSFTLSSCNQIQSGGRKNVDDSFTLSSCNQMQSDSWSIPETNSLSLIPPSINRESSADRPKESSPVSNSSNNRTEGYLKAILRNVISVKNKIKRLEENYEDLENKVNAILSIRNNEEIPEDMAKLFPASNSQEFNELEQKFSNDVTRSQLVSYLKKIGGENLRDAIKLLLKKVFTNSFAATFSFLGQRGKRSFKSTETCKAITEIVTTNPMFGTATEENVGKIVAEWLRHAKTRSEKRKSLDV